MNLGVSGYVLGRRIIPNSHIEFPPANVGHLYVLVNSTSHLVKRRLFPFSRNTSYRIARVVINPHLIASSRVSKASSRFPSSLKTIALTNRNTGLLPTRKLQLRACSRLVEAARNFPCIRYTLRGHAGRGRDGTHGVFCSSVFLTLLKHCASYRLRVKMYKHTIIFCSVLHLCRQQVSILLTRVHQLQCLLQLSQKRANSSTAAGVRAQICYSGGKVP